MAIFGSGTPVSKIVTKAFPVFIASGLRMAVAALVLLPFMLADRGRLSSLSKRDYLLVALIALVGMFGFSAFMLYGLKMVSGVAGSVVMSTTPAVTALASFVFLKERLGWRKAIAWQSERPRGQDEYDGRI
jgi:drug/metabolite transporter (DMT)-like permease